MGQAWESENEKAAFSAECHYNAWSGFGMVANCCGGSTLASDVWTRTIASLGSGNSSDPHGTIPSNVWDFSQWKADAVVINLGAEAPSFFGATLYVATKNRTFAKTGSGQS